MMYRVVTDNYFFSCFKTFEYRCAPRMIECTDDIIECFLEKNNRFFVIGW